MNETSLLSSLKERLASLRTNLLPVRFSATGDYNARQLDKARGYKLLVHAEIEYYLEQLAVVAVRSAMEKWDNVREPSITLISLLACYHSGWDEFDDQRQKAIIERAKYRAKVKLADNIIKESQQQFMKLIAENHGIKAKNIEVMFSPTGIDFSALDPSWLSLMDSFGTARGAMAHRSHTDSVVKEINPEDESNDVNNIILGLENLDKLLIDIL